MREAKQQSAASVLLLPGKLRKTEVEKVQDDLERLYKLKCYVVRSFIQERMSRTVTARARQTQSYCTPKTRLTHFYVRWLDNTSLSLGWGATRSSHSNNDSTGVCQMFTLFFKGFWMKIPHWLPIQSNPFWDILRKPAWLLTESPSWWIVWAPSLGLYDPNCWEWDLASAHRNWPAHKVIEAVEGLILVTMYSVYQCILLKCSWH